MFCLSFFFPLFAIIFCNVIYKEMYIDGVARFDLGQWYGDYLCSEICFTTKVLFNLILIK